MMTSHSKTAFVPIVSDTREQEPYGFDTRRVRVIRRALPAGDYSIEGMETAVAVERKSLPDFVSTVIHNRPRFYRELELLRGYGDTAVVVEGNLMDVLGGRYRSAAHPNALLGTIAAITASVRTLSRAYGMNVCPPNPGLTLITST